MVAAAPQQRPRRLEIGRIGAPHGLAGELRVTLHFTGSDVLAHVRSFVAVSEKGERELVVTASRPHGPAFLVKVEGVTDRDAAAALRGARVEVERSVLPPLAAGEYYLVDLIGATVVGPEGPIGVVTGIAAHPSVSSVELKLTDGRAAEQILSEPWVTRVDVDAGTIELSSLDGLVV
ncbi:MAG TPA: ribosome maturation factor RimM [Polyangiaceae bacterium]|nr:ribosome maturation factor RimM [Polyangiaceae bacterium]